MIIFIIQHWERLSERKNPRKPRSPKNPRNSIVGFFGFLVLFGFLTGSQIAVSIPVAHAQQIAVSRYTQMVLDRADAGIAYARAARPSSNITAYLNDWVREALSALLSLVDTRLRIYEQKRSLIEQSACLRLDLFLLETKIETVRNELKKALDDGRFSAVYRLTRLVEFLNKRYEILLQGAADPLLEDKDWGGQRSFDPPRIGFCCAHPGADPPELCMRSDQRQCTQGANGQPTNAQWSATQEECFSDGKCDKNPREPTDEVVCPFDSDYLPPGLPDENGEAYGCDDTAIGDALGKFPTALLPNEPDSISYQPPRETAQAELTAIRTMSDQVQNYIQDARRFLELSRDIDTLLERQPGRSGEIPPRTHRQKEGCALEGQDPWPPGAVRFELRGPFSPSPEKNEEKILNAFRELRRYQGSIRDIPNYLISFWKTFLGEKIMRRYGQRFFGTYSIDQGEKEAGAFAVGSDPRLQIEDAIAPLTKQVTTLSHLAHDIDGGLRGFVRDFAFFLRRTCIYRPCNARLEKVLKLVFQDACFPYTNGDFTSDDEGDGARWKKCARAACVLLPGMQESDLPDCQKQFDAEKKAAEGGQPSS